MDLQERSAGRRCACQRAGGEPRALTRRPSGRSRRPSRNPPGKPDGSLIASATPAYGECEVKRLGGDFSPKSFVDTDAVRTITVEIDGFLNPKIAVTKNGKKIKITFGDYRDAIRDCGQGIFPDWFGAALRPEKGTRVEQGARVPVLTASTDLAIGDLDGDGETDAVEIRFFQGASVSLADPAGTFLGAGVVYPTGTGPETLLLADVNNDGRDDILVADSGNFDTDTGKLAVLLGLASGTFAPAVSFPAGVAPMSVTAGDFNGDGKLDAALAALGSLGAPNLPADSGSVAVLLRDGQGGFGVAALLPAGEQPHSILAVDLDGDGKLDLDVANRASDSVSMLFGNGGGTFRPLGNVAVYMAGVGGSYARTADPVGRSSLSVAAADFNGDGRPDLAVGNFGDLTNPAGVNILLANASGTFAMAATLDAGLSIRAAEAGDFNGDGRMDLAAGGQLTGSPSFAYGLRLMLGNGEGTFQAMPDIETDFGPADLVAADFNRDGLLDLAMACSALRRSPAELLRRPWR